MQQPIELKFINCPWSDYLADVIRKRVARLEERFDGITSCHVWIEALEPACISYDVRIELRVPGTELVVSKSPGTTERHVDGRVSVGNSFDALERQLDGYRARQRGEVKAHETPLQGEVVRLFSDKGYGFAATTDGREIYFHRNAVLDGGFDGLTAGATVELVLVHGESPHGPQATTVRPIGPMVVNAPIRK